ncbi:DUF4294 domain-containing protein [Chitinophaga rhizosphaerae]|uniref:DUF4294 domain-containing protein n=1 Tax=Chitinophaga rhizosphaerae TaxID=1864947 RepID=UPI001F0BD709|nr:DUF4294 domain-containing protein [Chitinophaga rhizosphaerae]
MLRLAVCCLMFFLCLTGRSFAQQRPAGDSVAVRAIVVGTDTIPSITLSIFNVYDRLPKRLRKERERWTRLRNAVYVTYPYAVSASRVLKDVGRDLDRCTSKKQRKEYLASKEKELKAQFGDKLENLSVYQGKVLMKLIHRETGENCYEIIKELKGGFNARMYQTVAFFFGGNLKSEFNSQDDRDIELIVQEIQLYNRFN